jgi:phosphatidylglycerophosphatase A
VRSLAKFLAGILPLALVGVLYDSMRLVQGVGVTTARVHLCDLRSHELALFGITADGRRETLHDWFLSHPSPVLDAVCAVPYGTFILVCVACAAWLYARDTPRMLRFGWCFLALNVAGFLAYHAYPAAPPWYFHAHGCNVDLAARPSEGAALARVDARLGVQAFAGMYGRASVVFGAMPSLHCAYALLVVLEGWSTFGAWWRAASVAFLGLMCFAAVYLDHHWVLDVLGGMLLCSAVVGGARMLSPRHRWRIAWAIATWFGCGLAPRAPGTVGALGAIPLYLAVAHAGRPAVAAAAMAVACAGAWAASIVARELGQRDPQVVVVDEVVGLLVTMMAVPHPSWRSLAAGFALFRAVDILKPWPVRALEALPGAWGILLDDVAAGALAATILAALRAASLLP